MLSLPRLVIAGIAAGVATGAIVAYMAFARSEETATCPADELEQGGLTQSFSEIVCTANIEVLTSYPLEVNYRQHVPALKLQRDTTVAIRAASLDTSGVEGLTTDRGERVYPLHMEVVPTMDGTLELEAFFVPATDLPPGILELLSFRADPLRSGRTHAISTSLADARTPGVVVSTATSTAGEGVTFRPPPEGGWTSGGTHAGAEYAPGATGLDQAETAARRQAFLNEHYGGSIEAYGEQWGQYNRDFDARNRSTTAAAQSRIAAEHAAVQANAERIARAQADARLQRGGPINGILAGGQAVAEWMQQALDFFENDAALQAAEDCHNNPTNPVAQNAQRNDPENYNRAREQIREARSDNSWDTGVRALNTANGAASSAIPGAGGMAIGVASGASNATLRQLQQQRTQQAVAGVTPCDEQSTGGGSSAGNRGGRGQGSTTPPSVPPTASSGTPATTATTERSPGPSVVITTTSTPTTTATPRPRNSATVRVEYLHRFDGVDHHINYVATANLSNLLPVKDATGRKVAEYPDVSFRGEGLGSYDEQGSVSYKGCSVTRDGLVPMKLEVWVDSRTVNVEIAGRVRRGEVGDQSLCPHNVSDGTTASVFCTFENVEFQRPGGFPYRATVGEASSGPDFVNQELCFLDFAPLFWHDGRPVTGPRTPEGSGFAAPTQVPIPGRSPGP